MSPVARPFLPGRSTLVAGIVVVGVTLSLVSYNWLRESDQARVEADFMRRADTRNALTREVIGKFEARIYGLRHLFAASGTVTREEFAMAARNVLARFPVIRALEWVPRVPAAERAAIEAIATRELGRPFYFSSRQPDGTLGPSPAAAEHFPILYVEPLAGNQAALGFDLTFGPTTVQLANARRTERMAASRVITLVQQTDPEPGSVVFIWPVFRGAGDARTFLGFVQGVFHLRTMLEESFKLQPGLSLDMLFFDAYETEPTRRLILYLDADGTAVERQPPTEAELRRGLTREKNLPVGDRQWQVLYRASPEWLREQFSQVPLIYLCSCLALTGLSAALVFVLQRRNEVIERQVADRTAELSESRRQLESIVQALPGMAYICQYEKRQMIPLYLSEGALALTGWPASDFITGQVQYRDLLHPADLALVRDTTRAALEAQQAFEVEYRLRARDGGEKWVLSRGRGVYDEQGRIQCFEGLALDITARKQAETGKLALERRLLESQRLESLGLLAGGVAHDFNNLLTSIVGNAGLARLDLPEGSPADLPLSRIETASQHAADLCQQMLAYAGKGRTTIEPIDVNALLTSLLSLLQSSINRSVNLQHRPDPDLPRIMGDATQIRQMTMNLIINASEAIGDQPGDVTVSTSFAQVPRSLLANCVTGAELPEGRYVVLQISDTGCGMEPAVLARIFDPFFTTKFAGRGLGLSAILGTMKSHQGALCVSSTPGRGTLFRLIFPPAPAHSG